MKNKKGKKKVKKNSTYNRKLEPVKKKKVIVRKIKYGRILLCLIIIFLIIYLLCSLVDLSITNIYIKNNDILSDYDIIELASLENYPSIFYDTSFNIEKELEKNIYIKKAEVYKKGLKIFIDIDDNYPILFNSNTGKTIFQDKRENSIVYSTPVLINYVPDTIMPTFIDKLSKLDIEVINRISEIQYDPNSVDEERFQLTMNDGNTVYLTLYYFNKMNSYISIYLDIISKYGKKTGTLFLDSGEYFEIKN